MVVLGVTVMACFMCGDNSVDSVVLAGDGVALVVLVRWLQWSWFIGYGLWYSLVGCGDDGAASVVLVRWWY